MPSLINQTISAAISGSSNTTITGTIPSGGQAGDLLIAKIGSYDTLNPSSISATGWTIVAENYTTTNGTNTPHMAILRRWWDGSDPAVFNVGGATGDDQLIIGLFRGVDPTNPIGAISTFDGSATVTQVTISSINTTVNDSMLLSFCAARNGASSAADDTGQPTGMTIIYNRRSRAFSSAIRTAAAYENIAVAGATGTRQWSAFLTTAGPIRGINIALNPSTTASLVSVNGGTGITAGSTGNTAQLDGYASTPTSATLGPLAMTNLSYNATTKVLTFDCPAYADGATWPLFDSTANFTVVAGAQSATLNNVPTNPPAGWAQVTISSPNTSDITYIGNHTDLSDHEIVYETKIGQSLTLPTEGLIVYADGGVSLPSDLAGDHIMYKRNLTTGLVIQLIVTINGDGEVIVVTGNSEATFKGGRLEAKESLATFRAKLPFQAQSVAANITTLRTDFNSLLSKMALAGWFEGGEVQLTMLKISLQCGLPQLVKRIKQQAPEQMPVQTASVAADVTALRNDLNALLTKMKNANLMATS